MAWEYTTFERQKLYDEVWAEPMTTVAQRYGLSDVGLRKICVKLDVPVPPRGYWARLAAGHRVDKEPIPKSDANPTFVRSVRIEDRNEELEQRVARVRAAAMLVPATDELTYKAPSDLSKLGHEAAQIDKATAKLKEKDGVIILSRDGWVDLSISPDSRARVLVLLDHLVFAVKAMGGSFDLRLNQENMLFHRRATNANENRGTFQMHGTKYFVRIKERILQEEIVEPSPPKPMKLNRPGNRYEPDFSAAFRPKNFSFMPTGKLQLSVYRARYSYEIAKTEDTVSTVIEDKLLALVQKVEALSLKSKIEDEIQRERQLERERKTKIWEGKKAQKDALLRQLEEFEKMARNLDRAESLRRLGARIRQYPGTPVELATNLDLLTAMADWLDPLIRRHWPEVDDVPDKNPHFWQ